MHVHRRVDRSRTIDEHGNDLTEELDARSPVAPEHPISAHAVELLWGCLDRKVAGETSNG